MKKILYKLVTFLSSMSNGKYAGKMISMFDFCRDVICKNKKVFAGQIHERMDINNIIPMKKENISHRVIEPTDNIKVRIVYPSGCSWNNIHTLYEEFKKDDRFQTIVLVQNEPRFVDIMKKVGCNFAFLDKYDVKTDLPDILVATDYSNSNSKISFSDCRKYIKKVYSAFPNAVMNEETVEIHWKYVHNAYKYLKPDYYLLDPLPYEGLKGFIDASRLVCMGNPQFDEIFNEVGKRHSSPESWKKLTGKKVFLWATDHGINESYPKNGFTIDLYLRPLIDYFINHPQEGLIFRPHPQFVREMLKAGHFWSCSDLENLKRYFSDSTNMVWDDTFDYCCAYDSCDALIVDANCSITCTFLTTGKPICRLLRDDIDEWLISPSISDCYYYAKGMKELESFMDMIVRGEDEKKPLREQARQKVILNFDGKNGKRMKEFIVNDFFKGK